MKTCMAFKTNRINLALMIFVALTSIGIFLNQMHKGMTAVRPDLGHQQESLT